jgi:4-carboxymuconolactone decarboxylase
VPEPLAPSTLDDHQRRLLSEIISGPRAQFLSGASSAQGWALPGPFGPMLLAPHVGGPLQALGAAVRYGGQLGDAVRELAIVATAAACGSPYELDHHLPLAREAGVAEHILDAVANGRGVPDPAGAAVAEVCRQLTETGTVEEPLFAAVEADLGRAQAFELVVLAGYYRLLATILAAYGIG